MSRPVLVALTGAAQRTVMATVGGSRAWVVARQCPDLADVMAAATAGVADVVVISADLPLLDRSALADLAAAGVGIVGIHAPGDEEGQRRLRQWGITVVLAADATVRHLEAGLHEACERRGELVGLVQQGTGDAWVDGAAFDDVNLLTGKRRVLAQLRPDTPPDAKPAVGTIVAVWGPTGAPGRSMVARHLAAEFAAQGRSTLLVDADPYGGTQAQALALLHEAPGLLAACRAADQGLLDLPMLARLAPYVCPELRILTGIPGAARWPELRAAPLRQILTLARSLSEMVVIDCGFCLEEDEELSYDTRAPRRNAATLTSLRTADDIVVVGAGDPIGLQRLVRGLAELAELLNPLGDGLPGIGSFGDGPTRSGTTTTSARGSGTFASGQARRHVVVNRVRQVAVGEDPASRIRSVLERFAKVSDVLQLPEDPVAVDGALLAGQTLGEFAAGSPVRRVLSDLAQHIRAGPEGTVDGHRLPAVHGGRTERAQRRTRG